MLRKTDRIKNQANRTKSTTKTKGEHLECHSYLHKFDREFPNLTPFELEVEILQCDFCCNVVPNKASYGIHWQSLSQTPHIISAPTKPIWYGRHLSSEQSNHCNVMNKVVCTQQSITNAFLKKTVPHIMHKSTDYYNCILQPVQQTLLEETVQIMKVFP